MGELLRGVSGLQAPPPYADTGLARCGLRGKLSEHGARAVVNVWGVGYRFSDVEPARP